MNAAVRIVGGFVVSLLAATAAFLVSFVIFVKFTGPHSPLVFFSYVLALIALIWASFAWQRWARRKKPNT